MSCTIFPLYVLTAISIQDLVWIWFQCIALDWHDQAAMSRQTVGHQGVPKSTSIHHPGTHWLAPGPRYCLPSTRAHSTNNCAPAPPSKEPGARPVFQYLVSCQTPANLLLPTWVSNLGSNFSLPIAVFGIGYFHTDKHQQQQHQQISVFDKQSNLCVS